LRHLHCLKDRLYSWYLRHQESHGTCLRSSQVFPGVLRAGLFWKGLQTSAVVLQQTVVGRSSFQHLTLTDFKDGAGTKGILTIVKMGGFC